MADRKRPGDTPVTRWNTREKWNLLNIAERARSSMVSRSPRLLFMVWIARSTARRMVSSIASSFLRDVACRVRAQEREILAAARISTDRARSKCPDHQYRYVFLPAHGMNFSCAGQGVATGRPASAVVRRPRP